VTDRPDHGALPPGQDSTTAPRRNRRLGLFLAGLFLAVATAGGAVAGLVAVRGGGVPADSAVPAASSTQDPGRSGIARQSDRRDAIAELLERRARALLRHDRVAFLSTVDARSAAFRSRQATWFDNLAEVPLAGWRYRLADQVQLTPRPERSQPKLSSSSSPEIVTASVEVGYQLRGHDRVPKRFDQTLTFDRRDGRWVVVGQSVGDQSAGSLDGSLDGAAGLRQLWDFGRVRAVRARHGLVLGLGSQDSLRAYARDVDRAVPRVLKFWSSQWSGRVVIVVPRTEEQMAALLGGRPAQYSRIAAITRGELGATEDAAPADRVFINPQGFGRLSTLGRQVIMTHEITHVAARAQTQRWTPKWLSEGLADYVGFRDSGLATRTVAQELTADVRRGRLPSGLPGDDAFLTTGKGLPQAYEQSWLACRLIAERYGTRALVGFYRAVGTVQADVSGAVERAFREQLGTTQAAFTRQWRAYLQRQLT